MRLEGKSAIVTGAASGIGQATAQLLASEGATVLAVDRPGSALDKTVSEAANGERISPFEATLPMPLPHRESFRGSA